MVFISTAQLGLTSSWSDLEVGRITRSSIGDVCDIAVDLYTTLERERIQRAERGIEAWERRTAEVRQKIKRRIYVDAQDEYGSSPSRRKEEQSKQKSMQFRMQKHQAEYEAAVAAVSQADSNRMRMRSVFAESALLGAQTEPINKKQRALKAKKLIRPLSDKIVAAEAAGRHKYASGLRLHRAIARAHCGQFAAAQVDVKMVLQLAPQNTAALSLQAKLVRHTSAEREATHRLKCMAVHGQTSQPRMRGLEPAQLLRSHSPGLMYRPDALAYGRFLGSGRDDDVQGFTSLGATAARGHDVHEEHRNSAILAPYGPAAEARALHAVLNNTVSTSSADTPSNLQKFRLCRSDISRNRQFPEFWRPVKPSAALSDDADKQLPSAQVQSTAKPSHWDHVIPRVADLLLDDEDKEALRHALQRTLPMILQTFEYYAHLALTSPVQRDLSSYQRTKESTTAPGYGKVKPKLVHHKMAAMAAISAAANIGVKTTHGVGKQTLEEPSTDSDSRSPSNRDELWRRSNLLEEQQRARVKTSFLSLSSVWNMANDDVQESSLVVTTQLNGHKTGSPTTAKSKLRSDSNPNIDLIAKLTQEEVQSDEDDEANNFSDDDVQQSITQSMRYQSIVTESTNVNREMTEGSSTAADLRLVGGETRKDDSHESRVGVLKGTWTYDRPDWLITLGQLRLLAIDCRLQLAPLRCSQADLGRMLWFSSREVHKGQNFMQKHDVSCCDEMQSNDCSIHEDAVENARGQFSLGETAPLARSLSAHTDIAFKNNDVQSGTCCSDGGSSGVNDAIQTQLSRIDVNNPHDMANEAHIYEFIELLCRLACHIFRGSTRKLDKKQQLTTELHRGGWHPPTTAVKMLVSVPCAQCFDQLVETVLLPHSCSHDAVSKLRWQLAARTTAKVLQRYRRGLSVVFRHMALSRQYQLDGSQYQHCGGDGGSDNDDPKISRPASGSGVNLEPGTLLELMDDTLSFNELLRFFITAKISIKPKVLKLIWTEITGDNEIQPEHALENENTEMVLDQFVEFVGGLGLSIGSQSVERFLTREFLPKACKAMDLKPGALELKHGLDDNFTRFTR